MTRQSSVGRVLSGGASFGAIQVGIACALHKRDIKRDVIVATSAEVINGAFIALRPQTVETADELATIWHARQYELQVAITIAGGASNREAAAALFLSPKTIEFHLGRIYRKLGLRTRSELAALAARCGGLDDEAPHP
jgi:DNA-binding CsgD family transcriptional regulator